MSPKISGILFAPLLFGSHIRKPQKPIMRWRGRRRGVHSRNSNLKWQKSRHSFRPQLLRLQEERASPFGQPAASSRPQGPFRGTANFIYRTIMLFLQARSGTGKRNGAWRERESCNAKRSRRRGGKRNRLAVRCRNYDAWRTRRNKIARWTSAHMYVREHTTRRVL